MINEVYIIDDDESSIIIGEILKKVNGFPVKSALRDKKRQGRVGVPATEITFFA